MEQANNIFLLVIYALIYFSEQANQKKVRLVLFDQFEITTPTILYKKVWAVI